MSRAAIYLNGKLLDDDGIRAVKSFLSIGFVDAILRNEDGSFRLANKRGQETTTRDGGFTWSNSEPSQPLTRRSWGIISIEKQTGLRA